ncbi:hypothetical protein [Enterococcus saccharolyticus]|uniref:hypothetical protein n=1 Tax=Enterococcus saccharolyticus TaxID=41997 RepID=UPI0039DF81B3
MAEPKEKEVVSFNQPKKVADKPAESAPKRRKAYSSKIGNYTYRQVLLKLNTFKRGTGQNTITLEVKRLGNFSETWLNYGSESILLEDSVSSYDQCLQDASLLRRYLLDRGFKVYIKTED